MASQLLLMNLPYDCSDRELKEWIESRGLEIESTRIVRDLVSGVSPAFGYAALKDYRRLDEAVSLLSGKKLRNQTVTVKPASLLQAMESHQGRTAKR